MPIFILIIGVILIASGVNDKLGQLTDLLKEDFNPSDNGPGFHYWGLGIIGIGAIGYYKPLRPFSLMFLALIIVGILLKKDGGFFDKLNKTLKG